jgi:hypothetical protein
MNMEIIMSDGTAVERTVGLIDRSNGFLILSDTLSVDTLPGDVVKRRLGVTAADDIEMLAFGTFPASDPIPGDETWGFRGTVLHDHPEIQLGMRVRAEITLVDGETNIFRKAVGTVINE